MSQAFLLRYQEDCPENLPVALTCATQTVTFVRAEQNDSDPNSSGHAVVPTPVLAAAQTHMIVNHGASAEDAIRTADGVPSASKSAQTQQSTIQMATMTVTQVQKEQRDADPRNSVLEVVPVSAPRDGTSSDRRIIMATQTATKTHNEARDADRSSRSRQVVPRGPGLHEQ